MMKTEDSKTVMDILLVIRFHHVREEEGPLVRFSLNGRPTVVSGSTDENEVHSEGHGKKTGQASESNVLKGGSNALEASILSQEHQYDAIRRYVKGITFRIYALKLTRLSYSYRCHHTLACIPTQELFTDIHPMFSQIPIYQCLASP
jgi:hypothetical protein